MDIIPQAPITTGAAIAATRHLLGLSQSELAAQLGVGRDAVKDWETNRFTPRGSVLEYLQALRLEHDREAERLARAAGDAITIYLPDGPKPRGWYTALGARILASNPHAHLDWAHRNAKSRVTRVLQLATNLDLTSVTIDDLLLWSQHLADGLRDGDATGAWTVDEASDHLNAINTELDTRAI